MEILSFLVQAGILKKKGIKYERVESFKWYNTFHNIRKINHINWSNRATASLDYDQEVNFHKIMNFTINKKDIPNIKSDILNFLNFLLEKYFSDEERKKRILGNQKPST